MILYQNSRRWRPIIMISFDVPTVCEREFIEKNCARPPKAQDSCAQLRADPDQA